MNGVGSETGPSAEAATGEAFRASGDEIPRLTMPAVLAREGISMWVMLLVTAGIVVGSYGAALAWMLHHWFRIEAYSPGPLVPLMVILMVVTKIRHSPFLPTIPNVWKAIVGFQVILSMAIAFTAFQERPFAYLIDYAPGLMIAGHFYLQWRLRRPRLTESRIHPGVPPAVHPENAPAMDYYKVVGVPEDATRSQIGRAYRRAAKSCHPDKNRDDPTAEEEFKRLGEAYEVLSDPQKRIHYDRERRPIAPSSAPRDVYQRVDQELREMAEAGRRAVRETARKNIWAVVFVVALVAGYSVLGSEGEAASPTQQALWSAYTLSFFIFFPLVSWDLLTHVVPQRQNRTKIELIAAGTAVIVACLFLKRFWEPLGYISIEILFFEFTLFMFYVAYLFRRTFVDANGEADMRAAAWGIVFVVGAGLLHFLAVRGNHLERLSIAAYVATVYGLIWWFYGARGALAVFFPVACLVAMVPMEFLEEQQLMVQMRTFATKGSVFFMQMLGLNVQYDGGTTFAVKGQQFGVADVCSGLRSLIALTAIGATFAYLTQKTLLRQWIVGLSAIPIALLTNVIRLVFVGIAAQFFGQDVAMAVHDKAIVLYVFSIVLLLSLDRIINRIEKAGWFRIENF